MMWPGTAEPVSGPKPEPGKDVTVEVACCCCCCCCCPSAAPGCTAAAVVGEERASVTPGTEIKYTEPVGSVPP